MEEQGKLNVTEDVTEAFAQELLNEFPSASVEVRENKLGRKRVWIRVDRKEYKALMRHLRSLDPEAHYSIGIEQDMGDHLGFTSHLLLTWRGEALSVLVEVKAPKDDPRIDDISEIFPIALQFEREGMEMVGIDFEGAPDKRRLFLPEDFPEGIYPLRLDDKGVSEDMVKNAGHPYYLKGGSKR